MMLKTAQNGGSNCFCAVPLLCGLQCCSRTVVVNKVASHKNPTVQFPPGETFEEEVQAEVEEQYLLIAAAPVQHMMILYNGH